MSTALFAPAVLAEDIVFRESFEGAAFPLCGNHVVEGCETCDGNCPICMESFTGYTSSGTDDTCDVRCHLPIQACVNGDVACPFIAADAGASCGSTQIAECAGPSWRYVALTTVNYRTSCSTASVYGVSAGGSYVFTTCAPPGVSVGTGDPLIKNVIDISTLDRYSVDNDDCDDITALPRLAGWNCANSQGLIRMSCSSPNPAGFIAIASSRITLTVCPVSGNGGSATLYIWYNAPTAPNSG